MKKILIGLFVVMFLSASMIASAALREGPIASFPTSSAAGTTWIATNGATSADCATGGGSFQVICTYNGTTWVPPALVNCFDGTATPADCGASLTGSVIISAAATAVVVNTTGVTASSQIFIQEDSSLGSKLSVTCNTTISRTYAVTARTATTSFTITASAAPSANPACLHYWVVN